jgi:hypothetical protein
MPHVNMDDFDYGGRKPDPRGNWRHRVFKLREARGDRCENCGVKGKTNKEGIPSLEFAHIKPTGLNGRGRGQTQRVLDIERHPDAYRLLCKECHRRTAVSPAAQKGNKCRRKAGGRG